MPAGRKKTPDGRRVIFGIKLSEGEAAAADKARGGVPRSEWGRSLIIAALAFAERPDPARPRRAAPRLPSEAEKDAARTIGRRMNGEQCPHPKARVIKGYCGACGTHVG